MTAQNMTSSEPILAFGPFRLLPAQRVLLRAEEPVRLGSRAREILVFLVEHAGRIVKKNELIKRVWPETFVEEGTLRVHIAALRKALQDGKSGMRYVENITGHGYRFIAPITRLVNTDSIAMPAAEPSAPLPNLPTPPARIVGRDQVLAAVAARFEQRRFLTIAGPGGIGKTTVAMAAANHLQSTYQHGVCFVDLGSVSAPSLIYGTLASALGLSSVAADPLPNIVQFLSNRRMLIVLDNCEHVVDAAAVLAETLLKGAPNVHLLATSREPLRAMEESVLRLAPLEIPATAVAVTAAEALRYSAIQLFVDRATAAAHLFGMTDADVPMVVDICRKLDGLPLAIELAAARVDVFGIRGLAARLDDCLGFLTRGPRTAIPRHRTLRATLDWSYAILPRAEQISLCRLGVFAGSFDAASARAVISDGNSTIEDVVNLLTDLAAKSLLTARISNDQVQYQLLDTSRAYAIEKLQGTEDYSEIRRRHARLCCSWEIAESGEKRAADESNEGRNRRIDDIRTALGWCFSANGDGLLGIELTAKSEQLWFQLSYLSEYGEYLDRALQAAAQTQIPESLQLQLSAARGDSLVYTRGSGREVVATLQKTLALAERSGIVSYHRRALWGLWVASVVDSDYELALTLAEKFQGITADTDGSAAVATRDRMVALAQHLVGNQVGARQSLESIVRGLADNMLPPNDRVLQFDLRVTAYAMLARVLWIQGYPEQAMRAGRESIESAMAVGHVMSLCYALMHTATVAFWSGDVQEAGRLSALLLDYSKRYALNYWRTWGLCLELGLKSRTDDASFETLVERFVGEPMCSPLHLETMGTFKDDLATAAAFERLGQERAGWCTAELLRVKARNMLSSNPDDTVAAEALLKQSLEVARRHGALSWELRTAITLARLWKSQGLTAEAAELLATVLGQFSEGSGTRDVVRANTLLQEMSAESRPTSFNRRLPAQPWPQPNYYGGDRSAPAL
jgi:predicted ATPase/DNA-binding winged helix-turn-helix (wHTH) protein